MRTRSSFLFVQFIIFDFNCCVMIAIFHSFPNLSVVFLFSLFLFLTLFFFRLQRFIQLLKTRKANIIFPPANHSSLLMILLTFSFTIVLGFLSPFIPYWKFIAALYAILLFILSDITGSLLIALYFQGIIATHAFSIMLFFGVAPITLFFDISMFIGVVLILFFFLELHYLDLPVGLFRFLWLSSVDVLVLYDSSRFIASFSSSDDPSLSDDDEIIASLNKN